MKSQVLYTVWCDITDEAAGEVWTSSLSGVKGLMLGVEVNTFTPELKKYILPTC